MIASASRSRSGNSLLFACIVVLSAGCGGGNEVERPKLYPVSGQVLLDGVPLTVGTVTFQPDESKGNTAKFTATGMVDSSGNFTLHTGTDAGAVLGWYLVSVSPTGMMPGGMPTEKPGAPPKVKLHPKYQNPTTSGLSFEVVASPPGGAYDIKVSAK